MATKKRKKKTSTSKALMWTLGITFLAVLLIIGAIAVLKPDRIIKYYYDEEYGLIKFTAQEQSFFSGLFQQQITFEDTQVELGDTVVGNDVFQSIASNAYAWKALIQVRRNNGNWGDGDEFELTSLDFPFPPGEYVTTIQFTPSQAGTYQARSIYSLVSCPPGSIDGSACQSTASLPLTITEGATNTVTVVDNSPPECSKSEKWGSWTHYKDITGGSQDVRIFMEVDEDDCEYIESSQKEYRTQCDSGYEIDGTDGETAGTGQLSCVETEEEGNTGCNDDITLTCSDSSVIITQECVDGTLVPTNNECPAAGGGGDNNETEETIDCYKAQGNSCVVEEIPADETCSENDLYASEAICESALDGDVVTISCWRVVNDVCTEVDVNVVSGAGCPLNHYSTLNVCEQNLDGEGNTILYVIGFALGVAVIGIIGFVVYKFTLKKKKRK